MLAYISGDVNISHYQFMLWWELLEVLGRNHRLHHKTCKTREVIILVIS